jgi:hypothetical protein
VKTQRRGNKLIKPLINDLKSGINGDSAEDSDSSEVKAQFAARPGVVLMIQ